MSIELTLLLIVLAVVVVFRFSKYFPIKDDDETFLESLMGHTKKPGDVSEPLKHDLFKGTGKKEVKKAVKAVKPRVKRGKNK